MLASIRRRRQADPLPDLFVLLVFLPTLAVLIFGPSKYGALDPHGPHGLDSSR